MSAEEHGLIFCLIFNVIYRKVVEIFHKSQREFSIALSLWKQFDTIFMLPVTRIVMNFMIEVPAEFSMLNFARNANSMIGYYLLVRKISP